MLGRAFHKERNLGSTIPCGRHMVNPLLMALRHNRVLKSNAETVALPDTMLTLLLANCDPNELGSQGISPLCQALKFGDARAVSQLLRHHANPLCELDHSEPILVAVISKD